ncbi:MAG: SIS domain-containing protein [Chloroflexi bacterium]|nr:SIS domain-containing protein [Chloroflexota bacterium]
MMKNADDAAVAETILRQRIQENVEALNACLTEIPAFERAVTLVKECLSNGGKILLCGNGGSASNASHIVNDFTGHMYFDRPPLAAISLVDNTSTITATANDYSYDQIFSRQVESLGKPGDVLICFSTSGNSPNVLMAAEAAKAKGMSVIGFTNKAGGKLAKMVDIWLPADTLNTACSEHVHLIVMHALGECVEKLMYGDFPFWAP